jgi:mannose-6-phosphate isomerase
MLLGGTEPDSGAGPTALDGQVVASDSMLAPGQPHTFVDHRPWGWFEMLSQNQPATVKIITVGPGARLSLQRHRQRDEFWTILDVELLVEVGGREWFAEPGAKVWIPRGTLHRAANMGSRPGRFLELAYGHFDEGDIERLADDYDRESQ